MDDRSKNCEENNAIITDKRIIVHGHASNLPLKKLPNNNIAIQNLNSDRNSSNIRISGDGKMLMRCFSCFNNQQKILLLENKLK